MRSLTEIVVWAWSKDRGTEQLFFPESSEAWGWCADHPNDWLRVDKITTTVVFDKQDPLGLDEGPPEPIKREGRNGSSGLPVAEPEMDDQARADVTGRGSHTDH